METIKGLDLPEPKLAFFRGQITSLDPSNPLTIQTNSYDSYLNKKHQNPICHTA